MKVVSLNAWGGKLHEPLLAYLRAEAPDVLCLQEVTHTPTSDADWLSYRDGEHELPQRANLFREICRILPEYSGIFSPASQGELWDGERQIPSQFGLATFVHRSSPVIGQLQGFVHGAFSPHGYGDHPRPRNAHFVRVFDYEHDRPVTVGHMHGLRDPEAGKADTPARLAQARALARLAQQIAAPNDALVLCGDFNVEPDSNIFNVLAELGLQELVTRSGAAGTRTSHYGKPGKFADYLLVNAAVTVREFTVVRSPEVSDHCPLLLKL